MSDQATLKDDFGYGALREPVKPGSPMEDITKQMAGGFTLEPEKPAPNFDWRIIRRSLRRMIIRLER